MVHSGKDEYAWKHSMMRVNRRAYTYDAGQISVRSMKSDVHDVCVHVAGRHTQVHAHVYRYRYRCITYVHAAHGQPCIRTHTRHTLGMQAWDT